MLICSHDSQPCVNLIYSGVNHTKESDSMVSLTFCTESTCSVCVPFIPASTCPDKPSHTWRAMCVLFVHLRARTSSVTRRGPRAFYSCTFLPEQARSHVQGCMPRSHCLYVHRTSPGIIHKKAGS